MSPRRSMPPDQVVRTEPDRGREADRPQQIPHKGWWDVVWRVKEQVGEDNVSIVAAGLALFALLAVFPSLAAAVAIYGLFASPEQIGTHLQFFGGVLPEAGMQIVQGQLDQLASQQSRTLSIGVLGGIAIALWSARKGMAALMTAVSVAYNEQDRRGFLHRLLISMIFTVAALLGFLSMLLLAIAVPVILNVLPLGDAAKWVLLVVRWALLWIIGVLGLSLVYRFAPHREDAQWRWVSWGSVIAATLWILSSIAFALYVRNFDSFGEAYGALGGVVIMLVWFYISALAVILGAEINSELERQTVKDTTEGAPQPIGERGAYSADTVGPRAFE